MNRDSVQTRVYRQKVELLLRLLPIVMDEGVFAVHGGTAINLFLRNLPRYSVDIDLTYMPLADRENSINDINRHLRSVVDKVKRSFRGVHVNLNESASKLLCEHQGKQVKIEVNQIKRGIVGGDVMRLPLSERAQEEFGMYCEADVVPVTQLYGGKIAAALSRQHPRDLFDVKYMPLPIDLCREGFIFCLLGSDRPTFELLAPKLIDQREAMENQFLGMTDIDFSYDEYDETRRKLISDVNGMLTAADRDFLFGFEMGEPIWEGYDFEYFKEYPSVRWKLLNLRNLAKQNPEKLRTAAESLKRILER